MSNGRPVPGGTLALLARRSADPATVTVSLT
jgi:hypothetical protein